MFLFQKWVLDDFVFEGPKIQVATTQRMAESSLCQLKFRFNKMGDWLEWWRQTF